MTALRRQQRVGLVVGLVLPYLAWTGVWLWEHRWHPIVAMGLLLFAFWFGVETAAHHLGRRRHKRAN